jgi:hypothetical protein
MGHRDRRSSISNITSSIRRKIMSETTVIFQFDGLQILGVQGAQVFLTGECIDDQHSQPCVIVLDRDYLVDLLNLWLDRKAAYSAAYKGEFCGVGYFDADKFIERPESNRAWLWDEQEKRMAVRTFVVERMTVQIEHG